MADGERIARVSGDEPKDGGGEKSVTGFSSTDEQAETRIIAKLKT